MRYLLDALIDQGGTIEVRREWKEIEADTEEEAHNKAIAQLKAEYPNADVAVSTFATHEP